MLPIRGKRLYLSLAAAGLLTLGGAGVATASYLPFGHGDNATVNAECANDSADPAATDGETQDDTQGNCEAGAEDAQGQPGALDDGKELLPQATLSIDQAIAAAQAAASGPVGEIDLEHYHGRLVFNVDIGNQDVKIDAANGAVLGMGED